MKERKREIIEERDASKSEYLHGRTEELKERERGPGHHKEGNKNTKARMVGPTLDQLL